MRKPYVQKQSNLNDKLTTEKALTVTSAVLQGRHIHILIVVVLCIEGYVRKCNDQEGRDRF